MAELHAEASLSAGGRPAPVARKVMIEALVRVNIGKAIDGLRAVQLADHGVGADLLEVSKQDGDTLTAQEDQSVLVVPASGTAWWATEHSKALAAWLAVLLALLGLGLEVYQVAGGSNARQIRIQIVQLPGPAAP